MEITVFQNGPIVIKGRVGVTDKDGRSRLVDGHSTAVCRCGQSLQGLFCDGRHVQAGFEAEGFALEVEGMSVPVQSEEAS